jgi:hypothetical protein
MNTTVGKEKWTYAVLNDQQNLIEREAKRYASGSPP